LICEYTLFLLGDTIVRHWSTESLGSYLSGGLSEPEETDCERHLARCEHCQTQLAFLIRVVDDELAPDEAAVIDCIEAFGPKHFPPLGAAAMTSSAIQSWFPRGWRLAAVAAAVVLLVAVGWVSWLNRGSEPVRVASMERTFEARTASQPYSEFVQRRNRSRVEDDRAGQSELTRFRSPSADIGRFYLISNNFAQAIRYLEAAKSEQPASSQLRNDLGVAYLESGMEGSLQKALGEFDEALRLTPKYEAALFNLALAYERLGQFPEAEQRLKLYLQVDQNSGWAKEAKSKLEASGR
jgi:tetratricopeptide (TPR) repeat protein